MILTKGKVEEVVDALRKEMEAGFVTLTEDLVELQGKTCALQEENDKLKRELARSKQERKRLDLEVKTLRRVLSFSGTAQNLLRGRSRG